MLGIKCLSYYAEKVFQLPSGLTIYRSWFKNTDGTRGVVGGPHKVFTEIESRYHMNKATYWSETLRCLKKKRMQEVKFLIDATTAEIVSLARRIHKQI